jgi:hypothetical protein
MKFYCTAFTILIGLFQCQASAEHPYFKQALDNMSMFYDEGEQYDPQFFKRLVSCMNKYGDNVSYKSQNAAWKGIREYYFTNGTESDYMGLKDKWGNC